MLYQRGISFAVVLSCLCFSPLTTATNLENDLAADFREAEQLGLRVFSLDDLTRNKEAIEEELANVTTSVDDGKDNAKYRCFALITDCDRLTKYEGMVVYIGKQFTSSTSVCKTKINTRFKEICGKAATEFKATPKVLPITATKSTLSTKTAGSTASFFVPQACKTNGNESKYLSCRSRGLSFNVCNNVYCKSEKSDSAEESKANDTTYVPVACRQKNREEAYKRCRNRGLSFSTCKRIHCS